MKKLIQSNKITTLIKNELNKGFNADVTHENVCSILGLYGVKYFGHGTKYQQRKVNLIWNTILFLLVDFVEYQHLTTSEAKQAYKNYLGY